MNAAMEFVSGRCNNDLFCAVASAGDIVRVPLGARFVCTYCGGKLEEAAAPRRRIGLRAGAMIGGGMAATGVALFAVGFWIGAPATIFPTPQLSQAGPQPAQMMASAVPAQAAPVQAAAPVQTVAPVHAQPVAPAVMPPTLAMAPHEAAPAAKPALVTLAMAEASAAQSPELVARLQAPRTRIVRLVPPPVPLAKQAPAVQQPQPERLAAIVPPPARSAPPAPLPQASQPAPVTADMLNADEAASVHPTPAPAAAPAPVTGPTHDFVPHPIEGGSPAYPAAYDAGDREGRVTVSCHIDVSGTPSGCQIVRTAGGDAFAGAVRTWLTRGHVRFAPIVRHGQTVAETHQWTIAFQPQSGS